MLLINRKLYFAIGILLFLAANIFGSVENLLGLTISVLLLGVLAIILSPKPEGMIEE